MEKPHPFQKPVTGKGVELQHLIGARKSKGEIIRVPFPLDWVYLDGVKVGQLEHKTGCRLTFLTGLTPKEHTFVHAEVTKIRIKLGENIPLQEGRMWAAPPDVNKIALITDKNEDDALMKQAKERYGITEESEPSEVPKREPNMLRDREFKKNVKEAAAKARRKARGEKEE